MNLIDVLILGVVLLGALQGYRKGLVTGIASFLGAILGFAIAASTYNMFLNWLIKSTPLSGWLEPIVYRSVFPFVQSQATNIGQGMVDKILSLVPSEWGNLFNHYLQNSGTLVQQDALEQIGHVFAQTITENLIKIIAFVTIFLVVMMIVQFIAFIVLKPLGLLGGVVNSGGGLILGALGSFVVISIFIGLFSPILDLIEKASGQTIVQQAFLYPYLLNVFHGLEQAFSAQLSQSLLDQLKMKESGMSILNR